MPRKTRFLLLSAILSVPFSQPAQAAVVDSCSDINGQTMQSNHIDGRPSETIYAGLMPGEVVTIRDLATGTAEGGVFPATPSNVTITRSGGDTIASGPAPFTFTMPEPGGIVELNATATDTSLPFAAGITCSVPTTPPPPPPPPEPTESEIDIVPLVTGAAQSAQDALANGTQLALQLRQGGHSVQVSRNGGFLGTHNPQNGKSFWAYLSANSFNGDLDGNAQNLVFGADFETAQGVFLGGMLGYGKIDATYSDSNQSGHALSVGIYAGKSGDRVSWDAYLAYAQPKYDVDGVAFKTKRISLGASIKARMPNRYGELFPFAQISAWQEDVPDWARGSAQDISRATGTLGARQVWQTANAATTPWTSVAVDFVSRKSGLRGKENFAAPRFGAGIEHVLDNGGRISAGIDINWLEKDTRNIGFKLGYIHNF